MSNANVNRTEGTKKLPESMEGAYILAMAQNAILLSKPLADIGAGHYVQPIHGIVISVAIINFMTIAINWIGAKKVYKSEVRYSTHHLFWDILILAIFFSLTQTLVELCGDSFAISVSSAMMIVGGMYFFLNVLFLVWNNMEIRNLRSATTRRGEAAETIEFIEYLNVLNSISAVLDLVVVGIAVTVTNYVALYLVFVVWLVDWAVFVFAHIRRGKLTI